MSRMLSHEEAEQYILAILKEAGKPLSMEEIRTIAKSKEDVDCRDGLPRMLSKMKYKGLIKGELSAERKEWLWWI